MNNQNTYRYNTHHINFFLLTLCSLVGYLKLNICIAVNLLDRFFCSNLTQIYDLHLNFCACFYDVASVVSFFLKFFPLSIVQKDQNTYSPVTKHFMNTTEAVIRRSSVKKVFLILQNLQEKNCVDLLFG